jgi:small-conductance mechanosensitive channel
MEAGFAGNTLLQWITATVVAVLVFTALRVVLAIVRGRLRRVAQRTTTPVDDMLVEALASTRNLFLVVAAACAGGLILDLGPTPQKILRGLAVVTLAIQAALWANRAVSAWLDRYRADRLETDPGAVTTLQGMSYVVRLAIWSGALLLLLDNLGIDVTALVAGLGVGGIAIALAVQSVLGDLFASLSIALDKPFVNGDFVIVGDFLGTIERVGLKTTRVRSLSGEQIVFSNSDLLSSRIRNYKRMEERRVVFSLGVVYQTPPDALREIPPMIRAIIEGLEDTRFDRAHFKAFGDSAYLFEVVYYVLQPDYNLYMDIQQQINLAICEQFAERGIEIAYPTRTLFVAGIPEPATALRVASEERET